MNIETKLFLGSAIFAAFALAAYFTAFCFSLAAGRCRAQRRGVFKLFGSSAKFGLLVVGLVTALGTAGVDISAIVASLGLTGFALGFALRDTISNLLSGVLLILFEPFQIGDDIEIIGCKGKVWEVNLRYTVLHNEGLVHLIPNSACFSNRITKTAAGGAENADAPIGDA